MRKRAARDHDDAVGSQPVPGETPQAVAHVVRQRAGGARVEAQLHGGRDLVHVLPARAGGAHERLLQLGRVDRDRVGDAEHGGAGPFVARIPWYQTQPRSATGLLKKRPEIVMSEARKSIDDLLAVMAALRTPGTGCPWDLEQTFRTIAPYTIEEAYEVADAIERGDLGDLKEELGDLLLQVVYHSRMAEEQGAFAFPDVVEAVTAKMVRRHPHVFGTPEQRAAGVKPGFWERIKAEERARPRNADLATPSRGEPEAKLRR